MSDKVELRTFPTNKNEALTMLYLQKQDLTNLSPRELANKYDQVHDEIKERFAEILSTKYVTR